MREVCLKSTVEVTQQAEQLVNSINPHNKFSENIFATRDTILEKMKWVEDLSSEILNLFIEDDDFIDKDTLTKFLIFTKNKLLDIHHYIEKFTSQNTSKKEFLLHL